MPYLTHNERMSIVMALGIGLSIIIVCVVVLHAIDGLTCPSGTFC